MNKPKRQEYFRLKYSLTEMILFGTINIMGTGGVQDTDYELEDGDTAASGLVLFIVPQVGVQSVGVDVILSGLNSDTNQDSDEVNIAANAQMNKAHRVDNTAVPATWTDVNDAVLQAGGYGSAGDILDILGMPNPATSGNWTTIAFHRSHDLTPGGSREPIPNRMNPAYVNIRVREQNTFAMSGNYTVNGDTSNLAYLRGREVIIVLESREEGGPVIAEYQVLGKAVLNEPTISAGDNAQVMFNVNGFYGYLLMYDPS